MQALALLLRHKMFEADMTAGVQEVACAVLHSSYELLCSHRILPERRRVKADSGAASEDARERHICQYHQLAGGHLKKVSGAGLATTSLDA